MCRPTLRASGKVLGQPRGDFKNTAHVVDLRGASPLGLKHAICYS